MASIKKYDTAKGKAWRVQYRSPDGRSRTKQGFRTKNEAQAWADKNAASIHNQDWIDPNAGKTTIGEIGPRWLKMQTHLKPSTLEWQKNILNGAILPRWETTQIRSIKPSDVQEWVSGMDSSASWTRHVHSCLAQILDMAVGDSLIRSNPARGVKLPRRAQPKHVYLTMKQLCALARECGDRGDLVMLLGTSGLRWGEAMGLRPVDLDPLRGRINIERNVVKVGGEFIIGTPKTHEKRSVAVAKKIMDSLVKRADKTLPDAPLWESTRGGFMPPPQKNTWFWGAVRRCQAKDSDFPQLSVHGLRHVAAGLLVESGANVKAVQRQLGHKSAAMTLDTYAELFDDGLDSVAVALDNSLADVVGLSWDSA